MREKTSKKNREKFISSGDQSITNEESESLFKEAESLIKAKNPIKAKEIANRLAGCRQFVKAMEIYQLLLIHDGREHHIFHKKKIAYYLEAIGKYEESFQLIEQIAHTKQMEVQVFYELRARVLVALGTYKVAINYLSKKPLEGEFSSTIIGVFNVACLLMGRRKEFDKTLGMLEFINKRYPNKPEIILVYAANLGKCEQLDKAVTLLFGGIQTNPEHIQLKVSYAFHLNNLGHSEKVIEFINSLKDKVNDELLYIKAIAHYDLGQFKEAEKICLDLLVRSIEEQNYLILLAKSYLYQSEYVKAKVLLKPFADKNSRAAWWYVYLYELQNNFKEAIKQAEVHSKIFPKDSKLYLMHAFFLQKEKRYSESEKVLRTALTNCPNNPYLLLHLAFALEGLRRDEEAENCFFDIIQRYPEFRRAHFSFAHFYKNIEEFKKSEKCFLEGIDLFPDDPSFKLSLSILYFQHNFFSKAREFAKLALERNSAYSSARSALQKIDTASKIHHLRKDKEYAVARSHDPHRIKRHTIAEMINKIKSSTLLSAYREFLVVGGFLTYEGDNDEANFYNCLRTKAEFEKTRISYCDQSEAHRVALTQCLESSIMKDQSRRERGIYVTAQRKFENKNYKTALIQFEICLSELKKIIDGIILPNLNSPENFSGVPPLYEGPVHPLGPVISACKQVKKIEEVAAENPIKMDETNIFVPNSNADSNLNCFYALFSACKKILVSSFEEPIRFSKKTN